MKRSWLPMVGLMAIGCGSHEPKILGAAAPAFGSTSALSSTGGFLEGNWVQKTDITTARHKDVYATAITDMFPKRLKISKDGHLTLLFDSLAAKGTWKVNGPGIDVEFQEVSGMSMEAAKASIEKWKSLDDYERRRHQGWQELDFLVSAAESIKRLELDKDQKRLFDPTSVREDGTTFMGTKTWERQGK